MPYSITTKDGIVINNIPDNVPKDDPSLKARVAQIRSSRIDPETNRPMDVEIPTAMSLSSRQPKAEPDYSLGQQIVGAGEATLSTLTGIPASLIGAYAATPEMKFGQKDTSKAEQRMADVAQKFTYQPRTQAGKEYTEAVGDVLQSSGVQGLIGMPVPGKTLPRVPSQKPGITSNILGLTTGTGAEAVSQAYKAGKQGGTKGQVFVENLRGQVPVEIVLQDAKNSLQAMRAQKSADYVANKQGWAADTTKLNFSPIDSAFKTFESELKEGGKWKIGKAEQAKVQEVQKVINDWKKTPSLHTTVGLDALKQRIDAIYPDSPQQTRAQMVIDGMRNKVKETIVAQAPDYADAMRDYEVMSSTIKEIESALSLGNKASKDTALRKLQSLTRNNVQTNYGGRLDMANRLEQAGGENIMPAVSGQALSSIIPRGLAGQLGSFGSLYGALTNPTYLYGLPLASPRLVGEAAYGAGKVLGNIPSMPRVPLQRTAPYSGILGFDTNE